MIWLDVSAAVLQQAGVARYAAELSRALPRVAAPDVLTQVGLYACGTGCRPSNLPPMPFRSTSLPPRSWRALLLVSHVMGTTILPGLDAFELFHATDVAYPWAPPERVLVTVHDLSVLRYPQFHSLPVRVFQTIMLHLLRRRKHHIVAVSALTARELQSVLKIEAERISVVYPGVAPVFFDEPSAEEMAQVRQKYGLRRPFVLSVGTFEPRKNLARLIKAFSRASSAGEELLLVGPEGWGGGQVLPAQDTGGSQVRALGYVPDAHLRCLYRAAAVFVYPSLYEGFGSPVAEALVSGTPVICSTTCGIAEIAFGCVKTVDPYDVDELTERIGETLYGDTTTLRTAARGLASRFDYRRTAAGVEELYRSHVASEISIASASIGPYGR